MLSASDLPACPACGSREARAVQYLGHEDDMELTTLYACAGCGRDVTEAWRPVQPKSRPKPKTHLGPINTPDPLALGIGAELKT